MNHLSNFLLVQELWDLLISSRTRVVIVSSDLHRKVGMAPITSNCNSVSFQPRQSNSLVYLAEISFDKLLSLNADEYNGHTRYSETKLLNVLFAKGMVLISLYA